MNLFLLACAGGVLGSIAGHTVIGLLLHVPWRRIGYSTTNLIPGVRRRRAAFTHAHIQELTAVYKTYLDEMRRPQE